LVGGKFLVERGLVQAELAKACTHFLLHLHHGEHVVVHVHHEPQHVAERRLHRVQLGDLPFQLLVHGGGCGAEPFLEKLLGHPQLV